MLLLSENTLAADLKGMWHGLEFPPHVGVGTSNGVQ